MDQFTILNGQKNKLIHLECHSRNFKYVTAEFKRLSDNSFKYKRRT